MAGERETVAQAAETQEVQAGDKEKPFLHEDPPVVEPGPREVGLSQALGGFMPQLGEDLTSPV